MEITFSFVILLIVIFVRLYPKETAIVLIILSACLFLYSLTGASLIKSLVCNG